MIKSFAAIPAALALALAASPAAAQTSGNSQNDIFSNLLGSIFGNQQASEQTLENDWNQGRRPFAQRRQSVESRIANGVANGSISRAEADAFEREYEDIVATEARYSADGGINQSERDDLRTRYRGLIARVNYTQNGSQQGGTHQSIAARQGDFDARINQALQQRRISSAEAQRMRGDFQALARLEAGYQRGGIDARERADLDTRYDGLEQRLNDQGFGRDSNPGWWRSIEDRIAAAERSGIMRRAEAAQLRTEIGDLTRLDGAYAANGLSTSERNYLMQRYAELDARVRQSRR